MFFLLLNFCICRRFWRYKYTEMFCFVFFSFISDLYQFPMKENVKLFHHCLLKCHRTPSEFLSKHSFKNVSHLQEPTNFEHYDRTSMVIVLFVILPAKRKRKRKPSSPLCFICVCILLDVFPSFTAKRCFL